ncbi:MAG: hypothetical protein LAP85_29385 [Acidobacteriia bacterium]|nr:hypothetical protein [Terriglobia bacterium]
MERTPAAVYQPRNAKAGSLCALVEDYFEEFARVWDDRYRQQYGTWRPVIGEVMRKYLECGDLHRRSCRDRKDPASPQNLGSPPLPPPPRASTTLERDADFFAWEAAGRLFDGID